MTVAPALAWVRDRRFAEPVSLRPTVAAAERTTKPVPVNAARSAWEKTSVDRVSDSPARVVPEAPEKS